MVLKCLNFYANCNGSSKFLVNIMVLRYEFNTFYNRVVLKLLILVKFNVYAMFEKRS